MGGMFWVSFAAVLLSAGHLGSMFYNHRRLVETYESIRSTQDYFANQSSVVSSSDEKNELEMEHCKVQ